MIVSSLEKNPMTDLGDFNEVDVKKFAESAKKVIEKIVGNAGSRKNIQSDKEIRKEPNISTRPNSYSKPVFDFIPPPMSQKSVGKNGIVNFCWDPEARSENIKLSDSNMKCFLMEPGYCFRSVVGTTGIMSGIAYWELESDHRTENELKIGVVDIKPFNYNTVTFSNL